MPYLLLGSALQDSGKWKDGIEAYCECVRNATKGPVSTIAARLTAEAKQLFAGTP